MQFLQSFDGRVLFTADSAGRRESVFELLAGRNYRDSAYRQLARIFDRSTNNRRRYRTDRRRRLASRSGLAIVSEHQLFGEKPRQRNRRHGPSAIPKPLSASSMTWRKARPLFMPSTASGVIIGLITLTVGGFEAEFLHLQYADGDKLYVPVNALDLISRYTGASPENAPLHRLGSDQWAKAKKRAIARIRDVAAELLDVYARRAARPGHRFRWPEADYRAFENGFPFEPTDDQERTISEVLADLESHQPMDRVVCGDVGFGKTEVALRATFAAVHGGKQVAILVPTTLLAQQHGQTFGSVRRLACSH